MEITIYHNPNCSKSCDTLALIRRSGHEPFVIEYLLDPPDRAELIGLIARMGIPVRIVVRETEPVFAELGLGNSAIDDDALIDAIAAHPILLNRPIVVTELGARLCRPPEAVLGILPCVPITPRN